MNGIEEFQDEFSAWQSLLNTGKEKSNLELTPSQENFLVSVFTKTHNSVEFSKKLHTNAPLTMKTKAERLDGLERTEALIDIGSVCLIKAGFPNLISRHLTRVVKYSSMSMIYLGRGCFRALANSSHSRDRRSSHFDEILEGLDNMIGVLWACKKDGYPEMDELMAMWRIGNFPCAAHALKIRSPNLICDSRLFDRSH
jgi:hypothetical protein